MRILRWNWRLKDLILDSKEMYFLFGLYLNGIIKKIMNGSSKHPYIADITLSNFVYFQTLNIFLVNTIFVDHTLHTQIVEFSLFIHKIWKSQQKRHDQSIILTNTPSS